MKFVFVYVIVVLGFLASSLPVGHAQIDTQFCDVSNIVSDDGKNLPVPYRNESEIYSAIIERNQQSALPNAYGIDITELYDGRENVGVAISRTLNTAILTYSYVNQDEFLLITPDGCQVLPQEQALDLSPFIVILDKNNMKHLASPLTILSQKVDIPRAYLGSTNRFVRGIAVREWQACAYSQTEQATIRMTFSYSNPEKWLSAFHNVPGQESVPVQIRFDHKPTSAAKPQYSEIYSILEFKTNKLVDPAGFSIPNGVYCPGRFTFREWPKLPNSFSYVGHYTFANYDPLNNKLNGSYYPSQFEYDKDNKLARASGYDGNGRLESVIEDFETGLSYVLNLFLLTCQIRYYPVDQPNDIFRLDEEPRPEYLGFHYVRGISTQAWIAPRNISNEVVLVEWHFMTNSWASFETNGIAKGEPAAVYYYRTINGKRSLTEYQVAGFDSTRIDVFDYDVSMCNIPRTHASFTVTDKEQFGIIRENYRNFREAAYLAVQSVTTLRVIRLARLEVLLEKNDQTVFVEFSIMEKNTLGNNNPDEVTREEAYNKLKAAIANGLNIKFKNNKNTFTTVRVDANSLKTLADRTKNFEPKTSETSTTVGTSGGIVALLVIMFLIVGMAIGLVVGVVVIIKRVVNIENLPGPLSYFNPNFSTQDSS